MLANRSATINIGNLSDSALGQKKRWVCGLSRRYLWDIDSVVGAARYTIFRQGAPMSVYPTSPAQLDTLLRHWLGVDPQPWDAPL